MQDKHIDTRRYANRIRDAYTLTEAEQVLNWYATEVWNKALELVEQIDEMGGQQAVIEAIQQQIDRIGGKK